MLHAVGGHLPALAERFERAGSELHLVGGVVRDLLLGLEVTDLDLTTRARPPEIRRLVSGWADDVWTQGERFGTIGCRHQGTDHEITTYRAEVYDRSSRKPMVDFGDSLVDDLLRRDFTINAMAAEVRSGRIVDPHGGRDDLAARVLRTPRSAQAAFDDDPLRMLRAARFAARFDLDVEDDVLDAMARNVGRLSIVSAERIHDEVAKLLAGPRPERGIAFLADTGLVVAVLGDVDPAHATGCGPDPLARLASLLAPAGPADARAVMGRLKAAREETAAVLAAVDAVTDPPPPTDEGARRFVRRTRPHTDLAVDVLDVHRPEVAEDLRARLVRLGGIGELDDLGPGLDGTTIQRVLGLAPGPEIGVASRWLGELRLIEGSLDEAELERRLQDFWATRS